MSLFTKNIPACLSIAVSPKVLAITAVPTTLAVLVKTAVKIPKIITTAKSYRKTIEDTINSFYKNDQTSNEFSESEEVKTKSETEEVVGSEV